MYHLESTMFRLKTSNYAFSSAIQIFQQYFDIFKAFISNKLRYVCYSVKYSTLLNFFNYFIIITIPRSNYVAVVCL